MTRRGPGAAVGAAVTVEAAVWLKLVDRHPLSCNTSPHASQAPPHAATTATPARHDQLISTLLIGRRLTALGVLLALGWGRVLLVEVEVVVVKALSLRHRGMLCQMARFKARRRRCTPHAVVAVDRAVRTAARQAAILQAPPHAC